MHHCPQHHRWPADLAFSSEKAGLALPRAISISVIVSTCLILSGDQTQTDAKLPQHLEEASAQNHAHTQPG